MRDSGFRLAGILSLTLLAPGGEATQRETNGASVSQPWRNTAPSTTVRVNLEEPPARLDPGVTAAPADTLTAGV